MGEKMVHVTVFATNVGSGAVAATAEGVVEVILPFGSAEEAELVAHLTAKYGPLLPENALSRQAGVLLTAYFAGETVLFDLPLAVPTTPFRRKVYDVVRSIPYGSVATYSEVAAAVGSPGAARGVGGAMAANPVPVLIPCHRVVGAGGALTGFSASGGIASKKWLLSLEAAGAGKAGK